MKVLITGGAGYIGAALLHKLSKIESITQITVFDNLSNGNYNIFWKQFGELSNKVQFELGDMLDSRKLQKVVKKHNIVIHLAAKVAPAYADVDSHNYEQVNHWGTAELAYAIEQAPIEKVIHLSSTSVYGSSAEPLDEATQPNPKNFYGISKLRGEEHIKRLEEKINTITFRVGNVYGFSPAMSFETVINKFLFDAHFKNRISIHGNGLQSRGFISIDKVTDAITSAITNEIASGTYNLSDKNLQILDIVDVLKEIYPSLEFIFMNQHLALRDLKIAPSEKLSKYIQIAPSDFKQEIETFKNNFAFNPSF